ncbi:3-oxoacyl-ACP reductase [Chromatiales bacterium (ex Bugula neritina AB1)]|nr:3-oxoacyl-ACP reductase [Chromatiales bacterium (ex Bugula neritina AB1)]
MLNDEIVLVTGASRGIGAAVADELAALGATVIGTATSEAGAKGISDRMSANGVRGSGVVLDVSDKEQVATVLSAIAKEHGVISVLVNNAGITRDNLLMRMKDDEWDNVIATNLSSIYHMCKACLRGMVKARRGRIINIASVVGVTGNGGQSNYAAAKAGIIGFGKSLAREVGSRNITVNTVAPGFIVSDMTNALPEAQRDSLQKEIALGRLGEPSEIAHMVAFLASSKADYITGQTLHVNGGMYMN